MWLNPCRGECPWQVPVGSWQRGALKMHQKLQKGAVAENDANMLINATKKVKEHDRVLVGEACRGPLSSEARVRAFHVKALWPGMVLRSNLEGQNCPLHYTPKHPSSPAPNKCSLSKNSACYTQLLDGPWLLFQKHDCAPNPSILKFWKLHYWSLFVYWNIDDLQWCVRFKCTAKWFSYIIFSDSFPI